MQRHRNIEIEGIIVTHAHHEKYHDENRVVLQPYPRLNCAKLGGKDEAVQGDKEKLQKRDEVP